MKVQYAYLKNFLNTKFSQKNFVDLFTQSGFEESDGDLIEFDITPNRGDMLSLRGLKEFHTKSAKNPKENLTTKSCSIKIKIINQIDGSGCGNYHLMLIKGLQKNKNLDAKKRNF